MSLLVSTFHGLSSADFGTDTNQGLKHIRSAFRGIFWLWYQSSVDIRVKLSFCRMSLCEMVADSFQDLVIPIAHLPLLRL